MQITKSDTESLLNHLEGETREERLNSLQIVCDILERFTGIKEYMPGFLSNDFMAKLRKRGKGRERINKILDNDNNK